MSNLIREMANDAGFDEWAEIPNWARTLFEHLVDNGWKKGVFR